MKPIWLALLLSLPFSATAMECPHADFMAQMRASELVQARHSLTLMEASCPRSVMEAARRYYSDKLAEQARDLIKDGRLAEAEAALDQALSTSWAVSAVRGAIAVQRKQWKEAAEQYALAAELAQEKTGAPSEALRRELTRLALETQFFYGRLDNIVSRGGEAAGILRGMERGTEVEAFPLPVQFAFDRYDLTDASREVAAAMARYLRGRADLRQIALIGHADPRGTEAYNQHLSECRADAVAAELAKQGVALAIHSEGKGESEPPLLSDSVALSEEELFRYYRRVELRLAPTGSLSQTNHHCQSKSTP